MPLRILTHDERCDLENQYQITPNPVDSYSASGQHYILTALLNKLGFHPTSREESYSLTERLLSHNGDNDERYEQLADS